MARVILEQPPQVILEHPLQIPKRKSLLYTSNHSWVRIINDRTAKIGLSAYACEYMIEYSGSKSGIAYIQTETAGTRINRMESFGAVETIRNIFDLVSPLSGLIKKINKNVLDGQYIQNMNPLLNGHPEETWIVEIEPTNLGEEKRFLLTYNQYRKICERCALAKLAGCYPFHTFSRSNRVRL